ncbi:MAG: agmatinase [Candidatus Micrarchaeota archaeon]|nr:agmatinase [Candidatus Micrarchaeota archaeon]
MHIFHSGVPHAFLGVQSALDRAKYVVLSAPYDSTASYVAGQRNGPHAIIEASRQVETYDIELGKDFSDAGIHTAEELECDRGNPQRNCHFVQEAVEEVLKAGKVPILLGGEHSVSIGAFWALAPRSKSLSVLHIDAHADMRDEYEGTKYNHACVMRRCREKLHAVSVGVRSYSHEEAQEIKKQKADVFGAEFEPGEVAKRLKEEVYISFDLDAFDPSECPAVGTPEPGGLRWKEVCRLLGEVARQKRVVGFDIVELAPIPSNHASDFLAARLAYKLICYIESARK